MGAKTLRIDPFAGFVPTQTQGRFMNWRPPDPQRADLRLLSSGYGSGGKSTTGSRESIRYSLGFPHSRHAVSRFHYDDLEQTTMVTYFEALDRIGLSDGSGPGMRHYIYRKSPRPEIDWWNGAKTMFRNLDDPSGSKYGSMEVNTWFIDEGFEVPSDVLRVIYPSRLRWHLPGCEWKEKLAGYLAQGLDISKLRCPCPKRFWACTNPGPNAFWSDVIAGKTAQSEHFAVPFGENIYAGPDYYRDIEEQGKLYGEVWYERFVLGSWDAFEGQRFTMLHRDVHILSHELTPHQETWDIYEGHDFGWRNPHAVVWIAVHKSREYPPIIFDWYEASEKEIPDLAEAVKARRRLYGFNERDIFAWGDPAGNQTRGQSGITDIGLFAQHGVEIIPNTRAKDPTVRADLMALMFSRRVKTRDGEMAGLMFSPRATHVYDRFLKYRFVDKPRASVQDGAERFVKEDDHEVDATGYAIAAIPDPLERESGVNATIDWQSEAARRSLPTAEQLDALEVLRTRV